MSYNIYNNVGSRKIERERKENERTEMATVMAVTVKPDMNTKREQYRERRGEEYDIVSKVAYLIEVPDTHWRNSSMSATSKPCG